MFKNYIFDLYGTLIDIRTDEENDALWQKMVMIYGYRKCDYSIFEIRRKYKELCAREKEKVRAEFPKRKYVDIDLTVVFRELYELKGYTPTDEEVELTASFFRCTSTKFIKLYDGVIDFLEALKKKGKKIYLLSNAQRSFTVPELKMMGLYDYFDGILISSDHFVSKPDVDFFDILFKKYKLKKIESIMIGNDFISDISGAYNFGIRSLYIHQEISSPITGKLLSDWAVMDGDFRKIKSLILR
ncbi:MAG: HAD family hydrolase [Clostridia bacterium]|nr:HAD family hydrolase [Clostridia bacterium]